MEYMKKELYTRAIQQNNKLSSDRYFIKGPFPNELNIPALILVIDCKRNRIITLWTASENKKLPFFIKQGGVLT